MLKNAYVRLQAVLSVDFHILITLLFRGWTVIAGAVMVLLVPIWFTKVEQGYYYTFASLLALQVFFELGMNQVVMQLVGHEAAHLRPAAANSLDGPPEHLDRLTSLSRLLRKWYAIASVGFAVLVGSAGFLFFSTQGELPAHQWIVAWGLLTAFTAINLYFSPALAFLEGCGLVGQVARLRLSQSIVGYSLTWLALGAGLGLYATPIVPAASLLFTAYWLKKGGALRVWLIKRDQVDPTARIIWRSEIFPFQWRIAVSWVSGYFIFQLFTPMIFAKQGAVEAGKIGLTISIFNALLSVGMSWVAAKIPVFAGLISRNERTALNSLFRSVLLRSMIFVGLACVLVVAVIVILSSLGFEFVSRLSPFPVLICMCIVTLANSFVFAAAIYMRAHKEEPMLAASLTCGVLILVATYLTANVSVQAVMACYAAITAGVALPWTYALFRRFYRR